MTDNKKLWVVNKVIEVIVKNKCKKYELNSMQQQLLIMLAYHCNNETMECWPSIKRLANICKCSERHIQRMLRSLEKMQIITTYQKIDQFGEQSSNIYRLEIDRLSGEDSEILHDIVDNFVAHETIKSISEFKNKNDDTNFKKLSQMSP